MSSFIPGDPLTVRINQFVSSLQAGQAPADIEDGWIDAKEEAGRRDGANLLPGKTQNEEAAKHLAPEVACLANGLTGGAIILGIADDGTAPGTRLGSAWLRTRLYELTGHQLLPDVTERMISGVRCLVIKVHPASEPITVGGKVMMRVEDNCVPVPASAWVQLRVDAGVFDWSAQASSRSIEDVSAIALEHARRLLRDSGEVDAVDLADARDQDLLSRLGVVTADEQLTNAGALLVTDTERPAIDYLYREVAGGSTLQRIEQSGVSLLEQFTAVSEALRVALPRQQITGPSGHTLGQFPALPRRARREAIVNALAHRDWLASRPVTVELIGAALTVVSPGTFVGGVAADNIITHPSERRSPHLTEVLQKLRLAEREAVGVDRMYLDMLAEGHPSPVIEEAEDAIRVVLSGGHPDERWVGMLARMEPSQRRGDLNSVMILDLAARHGFVDAELAAPAIQRSVQEAATALADVREATVSGTPVLRLVAGQPSGDSPVFHVPHGLDVGPRRASTDQPGRAWILSQYVRHRGRISSREAMSLTDVTRPTAIRDLDELVEDGLIRPGGAGPTTHYRLVD